MDQTIAAVRRFNRFFTRLVGALNPRFLGTDMTLAEARLLFEIAHAERPLASDLQALLGMDAAQVSRTLRRFETRGLIVRETGSRDSRRRPIVLTDTGRAAFDTIDRRQRDQVLAMLEPLRPVQRNDLATALATARALLGGAPDGFTIRTFRTGDMGMIAARQSILYAEENGWGRGIEIVEGEVTAAFLKNFKPGREQCWVADVDGVMAGSIFLTDEGDGLSRLRLLYVEPFARGRGIGEALVATCLAFARDVGYREMTLWTHTVLSSARRIYEAHGFRITATAVHDSFGEPVQGETWSLDL